MSLRAKDGTLLETILKKGGEGTRLVSFRAGDVHEHSSIVIDGRRFVPYRSQNNLLTHRVVVLPSAVGNYESEAQLLEQVQRFVHRYVDLTPAFEEIASNYVLLTWGYDVFSELPYLRVADRTAAGSPAFC